MGAGRETRRIPRQGMHAIAGPAAACRRWAAPALGAALLLSGCGDGAASPRTTPTPAAPADASAPATATVTGFDRDGMLRLPEGTQLFGAAVQRDGRLLVAGLQGGIGTPRPLLMRLLPDGRPDAGFGRRGVAAPAVTGEAVLRAVTVARDGHVVVAGERRGAAGADGMLVARYTPAGALDRGFGRAGAVAVLGGQARGTAHAVGLRRDGGIVVGGGAAPSGAEPVPAVLALSATGAPEARTVLTALGPGTVDGVAVDRRGGTLVAGAVRQGQFTLGFLGRLDAAGAEDRAFGGGIRPRQYARKAAASALRAVAVLPGGDAVATGWALDGTGGATPGARRIVLRARADGRQVVRLERAARSSSVDSQEPAGGAAIAVGRHRTWIAGSWDESGSSAFAVEALTASGARDRTFARGLLRAPFQDYAQPLYGTAVALGRQALFVVGTAGITPSRSDRTTGVVARVAADDTPVQGPENR